VLMGESPCCHGLIAWSTQIPNPRVDLAGVNGEGDKTVKIGTAVLLRQVRWPAQLATTN
jgi:hypothetical protein